MQYKKLTETFQYWEKLQVKPFRIKGTAVNLIIVVLSTTRLLQLQRRLMYRQDQRLPTQNTDIQIQTIIQNNTFKKKVLQNCLSEFYLVVPHAPFGVIVVKEVFQVDPFHLQACLIDPEAESNLVRFHWNKCENVLQPSKWICDQCDGVNSN